MISSELPEILGMSDRIAVMHGGTVVGTLDRAEATQEAILELALGHTRASEAGWRRDDRRRYRRELSVAAAYAACSCSSWRSAAPRFFRAEPAPRLRRSAAPRCWSRRSGMTLVILCRQIDISIGSQFSICGVVAGLLAKAGLPMPGRRPGDARWPGPAWGRSTARSSPGWACRRSW